MNIVVKRKNNLFKFDHTHAHDVFNNGQLIGIVSKHANRWQFTANDARVRMYIDVNERTANTYQKLTDGLNASLSKWDSASQAARDAMKVNDGLEPAKCNPMLGKHERTCREIINVPSGVVYKNSSQAAAHSGVNACSLRSWLGKRQHLLVWAYYDSTRHTATSFYNQ